MPKSISPSTDDPTDDDSAVDEPATDTANDNAWRIGDWHDLNNGSEGKFWTNSRGNIGFITRPIGQSTEYPHDTEFFDAAGHSLGAHRSLSSREHDYDGEKNLTFFFQNDPELSAAEEEAAPSLDAKPDHQSLTADPVAQRIENAAAEPSGRDEIDSWDEGEAAGDARKGADELDGWDEVDGAAETRAGADELDGWDEVDAAAEARAGADELDSWDDHEDAGDWEPDVREVDEVSDASGDDTDEDQDWSDGPDRSRSF